jgi:hypothetical protein
MPEVWLRTNHRALALGLMVPAALAMISIAGLIWSLVMRQHWLLSSLFVLLTAMPLWMMGELLYALTRPRLAYERGELLVFLEPTKPTRVPIHIVECFFLGQGPSELPNLNGKQPMTQNVVVRLAESASDWKAREVKPSFGQWCDGYITIRGSWCEPIAPNVLKKLNDRLIEVKRKEAA